MPIEKMDAPDDHTYLKDAGQDVSYWLSLLPQKSKELVSLAIYGAKIGTKLCIVGPLYNGAHMIMQVNVKGRANNRVDLDTTLH